MPYKKGQSGNPAGRPVGSVNKTASELKEKMRAAAMLAIDKLQARLNAMEDRDLIEFVKTIAPYCMAKITADEGEVKEQREVVMRLGDNEIRFGG